MPTIKTDTHCREVSLTLSFLLEANKAIPIKKGNEKTILRVSNVKASTGVSTNAFFTMMALVENKTAPRNVNTNPATRAFGFIVREVMRKAISCQLSAISFQRIAMDIALTKIITIQNLVFLTC